MDARAGDMMSVSCEYCELSGRGLCDRPIACLEELYRMWYVSVRLRNLTEAT